jgi:mannosyltransferase
LVRPRSAGAFLTRIVLLGAGLRLYGLDTQSLWNDELSRWVRSSRPSLVHVIDESVRADVHPPGFYMLLYVVINVVGDSASVLRFPSVMAGTLAIGVMSAHSPG